VVRPGAAGVIEEVARLYVEAGADLVTTDTFGGTSFR
jgi:methionine synthase I (cobalamin-dependent)